MGCSVHPYPRMSTATTLCEAENAFSTALYEYQHSGNPCKLCKSQISMRAGCSGICTAHLPQQQWALPFGNSMETDAICVKVDVVSVFAIQNACGWPAIGIAAVACTNGGPEPPRQAHGVKSALQKSSLVQASTASRSMMGRPARKPSSRDTTFSNCSCSHSPTPPSRKVGA